MPVKLGVSDTVKAVPAENVQLLVDKAQANQVLVKTELEEQVAAPVSKGQRLGTMTVTAGEQTLAQVPLVAETAVPRLTFGQIFLKLLRRLAMAPEA